LTTSAPIRPSHLAQLPRGENEPNFDQSRPAISETMTLSESPENIGAL
jgi:hypothetical protein